MQAVQFGLDIKCRVAASQKDDKDTSKNWSDQNDMIWYVLPLFRKS